MVTVRVFFGSTLGISMVTVGVFFYDTLGISMVTLRVLFQCSQYKVCYYYLPIMFYQS